MMRIFRTSLEASVQKALVLAALFVVTAQAQVEGPAPAPAMSTFKTLTDLSTLGVMDVPSLVARFGKLQEAVDQMRGQLGAVDAGITEVEGLATSAGDKVAAAQLAIRQVHAKAKANTVEAKSLRAGGNNLTKELINATDMLSALRKTVMQLDSIAQELNSSGGKTNARVEQLEADFKILLPNQTELEQRLTADGNKVRAYAPLVSAGLDRHVTKVMLSSYRRARNNVNQLAADVKSGAFPPDENGPAPGPAPALAMAPGAGAFHAVATGDTVADGGVDDTGVSVDEAEED